jgi:hypothetical protein
MREKKLIIWLVFSALLFAIAGAFARAMTLLSHNEHMYTCAGILISQGQSLYSDFAYLQTPYFPLFYGSLFKIFGIDSWYLLSAKLVSFFFLCISLIILLLIARRVLRDSVCSLCVAVLFVLNVTIINAAAEVSNYIMPAACVMLAFYVFVVSCQSSIRASGIALAGILLAIAAGTKLTCAPLIIPFFVVIFVCPLEKNASSLHAARRVFYVFLPFVAGLLLGALPMLLFIVADPESFFFNNLGYHFVNTQWRLATGYEGPMSLYSKLGYACELFFKLDTLLVLLGCMTGLGVLINYRVRHACYGFKKLPTGFWLALLLVLVAFPVAMAPTPSFFQYYVMPVSFLFIVFVYAIACCTSKNPARLRGLLVLLVLVTLAANGPALVTSMSNLTNENRWAARRVHTVSADIRNILQARKPGVTGRIATLSPLFVVEANLPIYEELSTGPFLYRIGDLLSPQDRKRFVGTSPKSIHDLFNKEAPLAVLVGYERGLDSALLDYALKNNYSAVDVPGRTGTLYIRP